MPACSIHSEASATATCAVCKKAFCDDCIVCEIDGDRACSGCCESQAERSRALGSAILALVAVAYLATLAIGYSVFRARPFVGGFAAVVAIVIGRTIQAHVHLPVIRQYSTAPRTE